MADHHTSGPWRVFSVYAQHEVRTPSGSLVAVVNNRRDARLIAAAPTLLAACRRAEQWLEGWASAEPYLSELRAAIAEATGAGQPAQGGGA